ncbi:hypothetical protein V1511DRAFT_460546 [Dipodascopsis uninucleata]
MATGTGITLAPGVTGSTSQSLLSQQSQSQQTLDSRTSTPQETPPPPPPLGLGAPGSNIYTAVYSGVSVYEMMVNGVAVMRRRSDSYLNATQILKVGGVDKGRRTKILEKEIHTGEHEKVQGGYGKYQGTWVPFERGREFCKQYGVDEFLEPLLEFDPSAPNSEQTPTKEQAMAARRKQIYASASAQNSVASKGNASFNAASSFGGGMGSFHSASTPSAFNTITRQVSQKATVNGDTLHTVSFNTADAPTDVDDDEVEEQHLTNCLNDDQPPRKRARIDAPNIAGVSTAVDDMEDISALNSFSTTAATAATANATIIPIDDAKFETLDPLDVNSISNYEQSKELMTQIFLTNETSGVSTVFDALSNNFGAVEVDVAIDDLGHAALHWASALARIQLVRDLVAHGADPRRGNYVGETALIRAVLVTNNFDQSSFPQLLDLLYPAITLSDKQGRTVLHHISLTAGIRGRSSASRYYLECLLEWIVQQGSSNKKAAISLGKFISEVVNAQDKNGDTCLNIAARVGNKSIVQQLIEVGADVTIPNRAGLRPVDFCIGVGTGCSPMPSLTINNTDDPRIQSGSLPQEEIQKSKDIIAAMTTMISDLDKDFQEEIEVKNTALETMHSQLRNATTSLTEARQRTDKLKREVNIVNELNQRNRNLESAITEKKNLLRAERAAAAAAAGRDIHGGKTEDGLINNSEMFNGDLNEDEVDADKPYKIEAVEEIFDSIKKESNSNVLKATNTHTDDENNKSENNAPSTNENNGALDFSNRAIKILGTLPPTHVLRARVAAYKRNADQLSELALVLRGRSSDLEDKFRKVVALCTGVPKEDVDSLLEGLVQAVQSDPGEVDMARVAGFLRNVDESA